MDDEDFLSAVEEDNAAGAVDVSDVGQEAIQPAPEPAQPVVEPAADTQPAQEHTAPAVAQPAAEAPAPQHVPLSALLDERDKRKAQDAELARYRQQEQQRQAQQQPVEVPDMFADPDGYAAYQQQQVDDRLYQVQGVFSERMARMQHGDDIVNAALQWGQQKCASDPYFNGQVRASGDPVGFAVQQFQRDQIASQVTPDDYKEFQAWKAAQAAVGQATQPQAAAPASRALPPRSLASAPSAGSAAAQVIQSDEEMFNEIMPRQKE